MKQVLIMLLLSITLLSHAGVYKWVDENGKVHYGDSPGAGDSSLEMDIDTTPTAPSASGTGQSREEQRERLLRAMEEDRLEIQEKREKQKAKKQRNREKCNYYRDQLRRHQRANAVYSLDKNGNRVYLSEEARAKSTRKLQARINKYCK